MKSQAVAVISVFLLLATLIADGDCQRGGGGGGGRGRKREIEVKSFLLTIPTVI